MQRGDILLARASYSGFTLISWDALSSTKGSAEIAGHAPMWYDRRAKIGHKGQAALYESGGICTAAQLTDAGFSTRDAERKCS